LSSAGPDSLSLNKDLAELGWYEKAQQLLDRSTVSRADEYSYEGAIYRLEKAKKGPSSCEERKRWKQMTTEIAEAKVTLETYLDEKASREAAELAFQNLLDDVKAEKAKDRES
jgi:hypothetical protein